MSSILKPWPVRAAQLVLIAGVLVIVGLLAGSLYRECRSAGFGRTYCALTHLIR